MQPETPPPPPDNHSRPVDSADTTVLLRALHFAAEKHSHQRRKDREGTPYINHPIEVAQTLAEIGGVTDRITLLGAILHDTVEDTKTSPEELEAVFGAEVRELVQEVTDDKRLPKLTRKRLQIEHALASSYRAKLIKLADKICNTRDLLYSPPEDWSNERKREYLDWTEAVVAGCRGTNAALEQHYDDLLTTGRRMLAESGPP